MPVLRVLLDMALKGTILYRNRRLTTLIVSIRPSILPSILIVCQYKVAAIPFLCCETIVLILSGRPVCVFQGTLICLIIWNFYDIVCLRPMKHIDNENENC